MKWLFPILFFFLSIATICAQQISSSAAVILSSSAGSMSAVFGQVTYTSYTKNESISMGVLQVYTKNPVLYKPATIKTATITAWPNPVKDYLFIKILGDANLKKSYQVYTLNGQLIANVKIYTNSFSIPMQNYKSGIYIVNINTGHQYNSSFKIIKL
jgi:LEA14-like dessication related protein